MLQLRNKEALFDLPCDFVLPFMTSPALACYKHYVFELSVYASPESL